MKKKRQNNKKHIFVRYMFLVSMMLLFSAYIVWGMVKTTVIDAAKWNMKADSLLTITKPIEPERGKLLADNGTVLAANLNFNTVRIDFGDVAKHDSTFRAMLPALCDSLTAFDNSRTPQQWNDELMRAYTTKVGKKGQQHANHSYRLFRRMVTNNEYARIAAFPYFNAFKKSGLYAENEHRRTKPYGTMASRSIGFVGRDSSSSEQHGRAGLEMALDSLLYGKPGIAKRIQLNAGIVNAESVPAIDGYDITTTINVPLQDIVSWDSSAGPSQLPLRKNSPHRPHTARNASLSSSPHSASGDSRSGQKRS